MRKLLFIIMFVLVAGVAAQAGNVTKQEAARKATAFLNLKSESQLELLDCGYETMYLFAIQGGGFVLVSADNRVQPILAYSRLSGINPQRMPKNLKGWLDGYDKQIRVAMTAQSPVAEGWSEEPARKSAEGFDSIVGPLLSTAWGQEPPYNTLCPYDEDAEETTLVGCVATAMASLMKYWNWPDTGVGQYSYNTYYYGEQSANFGATAYDWANMPNTLTALSSETEIAAVSTLMYHCAVAVRMNFNPELYGGSSAQSVQGTYGLNQPCAENAMRTYFKYAPGLHAVIRQRYSDNDWSSLLRHELDCHRPILYEGDEGAYGHEFVCDGYDTNGFFHFNWGFSGSGDGYYALTRLTPPGYNFTSDQKAIVGLEPDTLYGTSTTCTVRGLSNDTTKGTVLGGGVYNYRDTVYLWAAPSPVCRFVSWDNGSTVNPLPLLAHDLELTASFADALIDDGTTMTYSPSDLSNASAFEVSSGDRIAIKFPASALRGHNYVTAVEFNNFSGRYVASIHRGGENAPGEVVYSQPFEIPYGRPQWYRAKMEEPVPIDTTQNLWISIRCLDLKSINGVPGLGVGEGNWYSRDGGETWMHLTEAPTDPTYHNNTITWPIRCITSPNHVVDSTVEPTAFILGPEQCMVGDTITAELIHSTSSTTQWQFDNTDWAESNNDSARIVWGEEGWQTVTAIVTTPFGNSSTASMSVLVSDCRAIDEFPYTLEFTEEYESASACWDFRSLGESGYRFGTRMRLMLMPGVDYWLISPEIDLSENENVHIEWTYVFGGPADVTMQVSQGGNDTADFTPVFTLEYNANKVEGTTPPFRLNDYYQGNPIRVAFRITGVEDNLYNDFAIDRIVMRNEPLGIADHADAQMAVYPNPSHGTVTVSLPETEGTLTLFDATGHQLMQRSIHAQNTTLDVSALPTGIYMVQFTSQRGTTVSRLAIR